MPKIEIPNEELEEWLAVLKTYQRNHIETFIATDGPENVAQRWLEVAGSPNIMAFGGTHDPEPFWDKFKAEFRKFLCDDEAYVEEKKALHADDPITKALLVSVISAALGAGLGLAATLLAPAVTVLLWTTGKMGLRAYCKNS